MSVFNEDTRVKIPATIQFLRIGYDYQSLREADIDFNTKIFVNRFKPALEKINGREFTYDEIKMIINDIHAVIKNNDLLNCISTIDTVTSGHITVNNQDITKIKDKDFADFRRENLGFIFQDFNLLDTLTIGENISLSLVINKQNPTDIEKRVHAIADKLGIRDILSKFPYEVSGGQKQRCACARALINEPKLILADEPTGALDSKASRLLLETMSEINKKMQATILMVTHDPFSASFCERILFLKDGKIFNEIFRGEKSRKDFFNEILDILTLLGGEVGNVR